MDENPAIVHQSYSVRVVRLTERVIAQLRNLLERKKLEVYGLRVSVVRGGVRDFHTSSMWNEISAPQPTPLLPRDLLLRPPTKNSRSSL
jgi:hypothetical protein